MIGKTIGQYRIDAKLGQGGMGTVYRAEDLRLRRTVAIKFLHHDSTGPRILQEARAASRLTHPNVTTIYEVGEQDGAEFIVMEYVEGTSLAVHLREGPLPLGKALSIAQQVAAALAGAEERGITHRDLKPPNIMITPAGQVKILDFGLAKVLLDDQDETDSVVRIASSDSAQGTLAYIAPEILDGKPATIQSDLFSFGIVLYEMLTGRHPFRKETPTATLKSIAMENPPPIGSFHLPVPSQLASLVTRCLQKDPAQRPAHARDVEQALERLGAVPETVPVAARRKKPWILAAVALVLVLAIYWVAQQARSQINPSRKIVLVLPEAKSSGAQSDNAWTVSNLLNQKAETYERIRPIPVRQVRDILRQLKKDPDQPVDEQTARALSQRLEPDYVLIVSVNQFHKSFTIHGSFIEPLKWESLQAWDVTGSDIETELFPKVDDLARFFFKEKLELASRQQPVRSGSTHSAAATRNFLLAEYAEADFDFKKAADYLQEAVRADPHFALAWARLALVNFEARRPREEIEAARRRALAEMGSAGDDDKFMIHFVDSILRRDRHGSLAAVDAILERYDHDEWALGLAGDLAQLYREWNKAIRAGHALESTNPYSHYAQEVLAASFMKMRRWDEAWDSLERLREIAPYRASTYDTIGFFHLVRGNYEQALKELAQAESLQSGFSLNRQGLCLEAMGRCAEAKQLYEKRLGMPGAPRVISSARQGLARTAICQGDLAGAGRILEQLLAEETAPAEVFNLKGDLLLAQNNTAQLQELIRRMERVHPESSYLLRLRGRLLLAEGKTSEGLSPLNQAAATAVVEEAAYFYCDAGKAALECEKPEQAILAFNKAREICRRNAVACLGLATAREHSSPERAARDRREFEKIWEKADPDVRERELKRFRALAKTPIAEPQPSGGRP